ncbi:MAG: hypothetical protein JRJ29_00510 [Deltaproteobacteria bacterium]|nr:hypothetical protein [Deltaproteobacteria bacterium]MBW2081650.1 hypothetical protein [Deltaproteobacteria bacterium]
MAFTNNWDETSPTDNTNAVDIDNEIRKLRTDVRERLAQDHNFASSDTTTNDDIGRHKQITFYDDLASLPSVSGDRTVAGPKKMTSGSIVPFWKDASNESRLLIGNANLKMWVYANTAPPGWVVDSSPPTDKVLAFAGGDEAYNVDGGNEAGTWTVAGLSTADDTHNHQWYDYVSGDVAKSWDTDGNAINITWDENAGDGIRGTGSADKDQLDLDLFTNEDTHNHSISSDASWRPAAAVGKMMYPEMS